MKILVFSDTHLTHVFEEKKYVFLKKVIESADQVIINGDFWDGYLTSFDAFISSRWNNLFPLLKQKKAVYIFGNHDKACFSDKRTSFFSDIQTKKYSFVDGMTFYFEHGNTLLPSIDEKTN
jgi:predicted MPP superfamily phosphohydrolase